MSLQRRGCRCLARPSNRLLHGGLERRPPSNWFPFPERAEMQGASFPAERAQGKTWAISMGALKSGESPARTVPAGWSVVELPGDTYPAREGRTTLSPLRAAGEETMVQARNPLSAKGRQRELPDSGRLLKPQRTCPGEIKRGYGKPLWATTRPSQTAPSIVPLPGCWTGRHCRHVGVIDVIELESQPNNCKNLEFSLEAVWRHNDPGADFADLAPRLFSLLAARRTARGQTRRH